MFTNLRKSAQSFFAKIILFFLVAMFAMWGIGDTLMKTIGSKTDTVVTVGKTPITTERFMRAVHNSQGQPMQVLKTMIDMMLVEKEENSKGIMADDEAVSNYLASLPELKGKDGKFDKDLYLKMVAEAGGNENVYVDHARHEIEGKLLIGSLTAGVQVPSELALAVYRMQEERRDANILVLTSASVEASVPKPTEPEIKAYYDAHAKDYTAPEMRTLSYVTLPLADVQAKIQVPEDEIKSAYEERKDDYRTPERRQVQDMEFDNEQDARAAADALAHGKTFAQVAATAPIANKDKVALGEVSEQELPPEAVKPIMALKDGGATQPLLTQFRWHIYSAGAVVPARQQTLDEARTAIAREIAGRQAEETAQKMMNGFEDALAGGSTLEQAADKIGQKVKVAGPVDRDGALAEGGKADLPDYPNFLPTAFSTAEKDHSQAVEATNGSYFVVRVDKVDGEHVKPLADVKDDVAKAAYAEKVAKKLASAAQDMADALRAGKKAQGVTAVVAAPNLRRGDETVPEGALKDKALPRMLLSELFTLHPGESTHAFPTDGGNYMIATLQKVTPAPQKPDPAALRDVSKGLYSTLTNEAMDRYVNVYLRNKYPVVLNSAALSAVMKDNAGGGSE